MKSNERQVETSAVLFERLPYPNGGFGRHPNKHRDIKSHEEFAGHLRGPLRLMYDYNDTLI